MMSDPCPEAERLPDRRRDYRWWERDLCEDYDPREECDCPDIDETGICPVCGRIR